MNTGNIYLMEEVERAVASAVAEIHEIYVFPLPCAEIVERTMDKLRMPEGQEEQDEM